MPESELSPAAALKELYSHSKPAWFPQVKDETAAEGRASKIAGLPLLLQGESWPHCQHCQSPLKLFLQLDCHQLPAAVDEHWAGLKMLRQREETHWIQLFYCTGPQGGWNAKCDNWRPYSDNHLARVLHAGQALCVAAENQGWPGKSIQAWQAFDDLPAYQDYDKIQMSPALFRALDSEETFEALNEPCPAEKDKLGGWPFWVQENEVPACRECGTPMDVIFQLDSEQLLPHMFGDAGIAHLSQCPQHPEVLAFGWACY